MERPGAGGVRPGVVGQDWVGGAHLAAGSGLSALHADCALAARSRLLLNVSDQGDQADTRRRSVQRPRRRAPS